MKNPLDIFHGRNTLITGKEVDPVIATEEDILFAFRRRIAALGMQFDKVSKDFEDDDVSLDRPKPEQEPPRGRTKGRK